jgi:hypothetical protein
LVFFVRRSYIDLLLRFKDASTNESRSTFANVLVLIADG